MVRKMVPASPTAIPLLASTKETPEREADVPAYCGVQVSPPSVDRRMVPFSPTAVAVMGFAKETLIKDAVVPLVCAVQVIPRLMLRRIVPKSPAAIRRWEPRAAKPFNG